jgi:hypothetical protein
VLASVPFVDGRGSFLLTFMQHFAANINKHLAPLWDQGSILQNSISAENFYFLQIFIQKQQTNASMIILDKNLRFYGTKSPRKPSFITKYFNFLIFIRKFLAENVLFNRVQRIPLLLHYLETHTNAWDQVPIFRIINFNRIHPKLFHFKIHLIIVDKILRLCKLHICRSNKTSHCNA